MQMPTSYGMFSTTRYRFICRESRDIFGMLSSVFSIDIDWSALLLFRLDDAVLRHHGSHLGHWLRSHSTDLHSLDALLAHVKSLPPTRQNAAKFDLLVHGEIWELLTTKLFTIDYSFDELVRMTQLLSCFSPAIITAAVKECEPGKNLSYLRAICERLRSQTIPKERKEELYDKRCAASQPIFVPAHRNPGLVSAALAEDDLFDWVDGIRAV